MIFSIHRPQYYISHTKSQRLLVARHRLSCEKVNSHNTLITLAVTFQGKTTLYWKSNNEFIENLWNSFSFVCTVCLHQTFAVHVLSRSHNFEKSFELKTRTTFLFHPFLWWLKFGKVVIKVLHHFFFTSINILSLKIPYFDNIFLQNKNCLLALNSMATLRN